MIQLIPEQQQVSTVSVCVCLIFFFVVSLETESFIITGLHEFVNYSFVVTIATSVGSVPSSPVYAVTSQSGIM